MIPLGISGLFMARVDLESGNTLIGVAQVAAGVVVAVYAFFAAKLDARRMRNPIRLVIARDGFELSTGDGPILWGEVATISDPRSPTGEPKNLRVQLDDPEGFADRQSLSLVARVMLRVNKGDLVLGSGLAEPLVTVEAMMRKQLAEFLRPGHDGVELSAESRTGRIRALKGRRPARKGQA